MRHAQEYLKRTRGIERYQKSLAKSLLEEAEQEATHCIDHMMGPFVRAKGLICPCEFHQEQERLRRVSARMSETIQEPETSDPAHETSEPKRRDGKMAAAGDDE